MYNLKFIIPSIIFIFYILHFTFYTSPTFAIESSQSASPSAGLLGKINQIKAEIASKAAGLKLEVNKKLQNKVFAGQIQDLADSKITITTKTTNLTILVNEYTDYSSDSTKKKLTLKSLSKNDYLIAFGDIDDKNNLVAKIIIKQAASTVSKRSFVIGKVDSKASGVVYLLGPDNKKLTIQVRDDTKYMMGNDDASFADIIKGRTIIIGFLRRADTIPAEFIYIPKTAGLKLEKPKTATHSASPSASVKK